MPVYVTIRKRTNPSGTAGKSNPSPAALISCTAVPALTIQPSTVPLFSADFVTTSPRIPELGRKVYVKHFGPPKRKQISKRSKRAAAAEQPVSNMMPAYAPLREDLLASMTPVQPSLRSKAAEEEPTEFERQYPW